MAMKWDYPETGSIKIAGYQNSTGYIIPVDDESSIPQSQKTLTFKGFPTPEDNQDANNASSTYKVFTDIFIEKLFGIQFNITASKVSAEALISGDPE